MANEIAFLLAVNNILIDA